MRKRILAMLLALAMFAGIGSVSLAEETDEFAQFLTDMYDEIEIEYRPDVRWWLAEGLNTDATIRKNIQEIYDSGFGAVEFLAMPEPGADSSIYGWGSEEWTADTHLIIEEATEKGMGFALTSGTHWANANLPDTFIWDDAPFNADNKAASKELDYATILLYAGDVFSGELPLPRKVTTTDDGGTISELPYTQHVFQGVVAAKLLEARPGSGQEYDYAEGTGLGVLDFDSLLDLTDEVVEQDGAYTLEWTAPEDGDYALFVYWMHGTAQTAEPSVSTNYTVNYIDSYGIEALIDYWNTVVLTDDLRETILENGRGELYMDSLELSTYGAGSMFWGYDFKQEFIERMGYDITPYIPVITASAGNVWGGSGKTYDYTVEGDDLDTVEKVRSDYYEIRTQMYLENVLKPLQEWLHSLGMTLRAQPSYGQNLEISTPAKYLDGVETESLNERTEIELYRGMLGSANMYGRIFSSETGAINGHNYIVDMDNWTQLMYLQFALGVNRTVLHGYSGIEGSESDTYWPGHEGMYAVWSERFNSRQPASAHYSEWTEMLARNQKVLRQGTSKRDIAILRTDYQFIASPNPDSDNFMTNKTLRDEAYYWMDLSMQNAGYTYDYFSPMLLTDEENVTWSSTELQPDEPGYKALILYQETLDLASANKILEIAKDGLPVFFVDNNSEIRASSQPLIEHEIAASRSISLSVEDEEIVEVVGQIKALPNVRELESPAEVLGALQEMGIYPRVAFSEPNNRILSISRMDEENGIFYTYVYSYKHNLDVEPEPFTFEIEIEYEGAPYAIDDWTGDVVALGAYEIRDGRTCIEMTLERGESTIIALDMRAQEGTHAISTSADAIEFEDGTLVALSTQSGELEAVLNTGETVTVDVEVPDPIILDTWDITVEDWNEGERVVNTEEKFGHTTTEVYYTTRKTPLVFEDSPLLAWKDLPATQEQLDSLGYEDASMEHVSGMGTYSTTFMLPEGWKDENGAYLSIESAGGGTVAVYVNGQKTKGVDLRTLKVDISDFLISGENEIVVEVSSTLTNRMIQRNYKELGTGWATGWGEDTPTVQDYGMTGEVSIVPYTVAQVF